MDDKNEIRYRFYSEKNTCRITFNTSTISISDIKNEIKSRYKIKDGKSQEDLDLLIFDKNLNPLSNDTKVKSLTSLIVKKFPKYKINNNNELILEVSDPKQISFTKGNEFKFLNKQHKTKIDPLEKLLNKITKDKIYDYFKCKICKKKEEGNYKYLPIITLCCFETICKDCFDNKNNVCVVCGKQKIGFAPNQHEFSLKEKIFEIFKNYEINNLTINNFSNSNTNNNNINTNLNNLPNLPTLTYHPNPNAYESFLRQYPTFKLLEKSHYFIIKSSQANNINISQTHNEWATTVKNQKILNEAFEYSNVILIFSGNKSSNYQGYAIMTSYIGDKVSDIWDRETKVPLGGSFSVKWLCICQLPFSRVKHLINGKTNEPVTKARDATEIEPIEVAYEMCYYCLEQEKKENKNRKIFTNEEINEILYNIKKSKDEMKNNKEKNNNNETINNTNNGSSNEKNIINNSNINTNQNTNTIMNNTPINNNNQMINNNTLNYNNTMMNQMNQMSIKNMPMMNPMMMKNISMMNMFYKNYFEQQQQLNNLNNKKKEKDRSRSNSKKSKSHKSSHSHRSRSRSNSYSSKSYHSHHSKKK